MAWVIFRWSLFYFINALKFGSCNCVFINICNDKVYKVSLFLCRRKVEYQEDKPEQYLRFAPRRWIICLLSISNPRTTACPIRRSGSRRDQCASSSLAGRPGPYRAALQSTSRVSEPFNSRLSVVVRPSTLVYHYFPPRSWKLGDNQREATEAAWREQNVYGSDMVVALHCGNDYVPRTRPWISLLCWICFLMTTGASSDQAPDTLGQNTVLTTDLPRTCRSGDRISDVASSICENPLPDSRGLGLDNVTMRAPSRGARRDDGVCNNCTKCIQLGLMCLIIIISQEDVEGITASLSVPYFHPLSCYLFSGSDLGYCLYFKVSLFYNVYKVLLEEVSNYVFLLSKNGSILE